MWPSLPAWECVRQPLQAQPAQPANRLSTLAHPEPVCRRWSAGETKIKAASGTKRDLQDELNPSTHPPRQRKRREDRRCGVDPVHEGAAVFGSDQDTDQGTALIKQIKADYPDTSTGKSADKILDGIAKQAAPEASGCLGSRLSFSRFFGIGSGRQPLSWRRAKASGAGGFLGDLVRPVPGGTANVIKTYQKHHSQGFEIIGVSLDSDRDKLNAFSSSRTA